MTLYDFLTDLVGRQCPEILTALRNDSWLDDPSQPSSELTPTMVCDTIRACLHENDNSNTTNDPSGMRAEKLFLLCRNTHPRTELDVAAAGAILSTPRSKRPSFYSYAALCKEPLVLFKARAAVWKRRGIRGIVFRILEGLMEANDGITRQTSPSERVALELLSARDSIIVRVILYGCQRGFVFDNPGACGEEKPPSRPTRGTSRRDPSSILKHNDKIKLWEDSGDKKASEKMSQPLCGAGSRLQS